MLNLIMAIVNGRVPAWGVPQVQLPMALVPSPTPQKEYFLREKEHKSGWVERSECNWGRGENMAKMHRIKTFKNKMIERKQKLRALTGRPTPVSHGNLVHFPFMVSMVSWHFLAVQG